MPFKKQLFVVLRAIWSPKQSTYQHLHFKGVFTVKMKDKQSFKIRHYGYLIENEIFWAGIDHGWEKVSLGLWQKLCKESNVIFDVGANTGIYSLIAKGVNPNAHVHAFEPLERVYNRLQDNMTLNNFDVKCEQVAVSNEDGTATIYDTEGEHALSVSLNAHTRDADVKLIPTEVNTITLAAYIRAQGITSIDLIKIDVETYEPQVLEGMGEFIKEFKPTMLVEILDPEIGRKVEEIVKDAGYLYFNIDENKGIRQEETIRKSDYYNYLLCDLETAKRMQLVDSE